MDFTAVQLGEYQGKLKSEKQELTVVVIAEGPVEAKAALEKFADHLGKLHTQTYSVSEVSTLKNFHVTYTPTAWKRLKESC